MSYAWPATKLPLPTVDFGGNNESTVVRTKMESGRVRQRKRFTAGLRSISAVWTFTDAEFALFQGVHKYKLNNGADWFTIDLPFGDGFKNYTVRFTGDKYSFSHYGVLQWKVSATLETESTSPLTEAETNAALA